MPRAVEGDAGGVILAFVWQSLRARKNRDIELTSAPHTYERPGRYTVAVKVREETQWISSGARSSRSYCQHRRRLRGNFSAGEEAGLRAFGSAAIQPPTDFPFTWRLA